MVIFHSYVSLPEGIELQYFATQVNIMLFLGCGIFEIRNSLNFHREVWAKFFRLKSGGMQHGSENIRYTLW